MHLDQIVAGKPSTSVVGHPAVRAFLEKLHRVLLLLTERCRNKLKQLGLATQLFESTYETLPPPNVQSAEGVLISGGSAYSGLGSVLVVLLPFLEEAARFEAYDLTRAPTATVNLPFTEQALDVYTCPSMQTP